MTILKDLREKKESMCYLNKARADNLVIKYNSVNKWYK